MGCLKIIGLLLFTLVAIVSIGIALLFYTYKPLTEGTIYLEKAKGEIEIIRETDTHIPHIFAKSENDALYAEGFLHAQDRLWQIERLRRTTQGRMSEVFGDKTIGIDKFFRTLGIHRLAKEIAQTMDQEQMGMYQAYSDGVNDFLNSIDFFDQGSSAKLLPPEFLVFGISKVDPWTPVDSICISLLFNFHLSWNWGQDLLRDALAQAGLEDMVEEIFPFTAEYSHNLVTILDEDDVKGTYYHSADEPLIEKYYRSQGKVSSYQLQKQAEEKRKLEEEQRERQRVEQEKKAAEEKERKLKEEQEQKAKEEQERIKKETDAKKAKELEEKRKQEEEKRKKEDQVKKEQEAKKQKEEQEKKAQEAKKKKEEEEKKKKDEAEAKKKLEEEDKKRKQEAEIKEKANQEVQRKAKEAQEQKQKQQQQKPEAKKEKVPDQLSGDEKGKPTQTEEQIDVGVKINEQASNSWVIHGKHTKSGKPILAGDPHLNNQLPTHWYLLELNINGNSWVGASQPGFPLFLFGTSKHITWTITSALADLSDLYREKLSDDGRKYLLDGQYVDLQTTEETILIKDKQPYKMQVKHTHRGPLVNAELLRDASVLFSEGVPKDFGGVYSLAWTGFSKTDKTLKYVKNVLTHKNLHSLIQTIDSEPVYASVPQNLILADAEGNIGYYLAANMPNRKNQKPYSGCRVLDGTTSANDWNGYIAPKDLPRVINPKKGYIVTANNRQMPETVNTDIGATITSTIRAQRITELIQKGIDAGHKFDSKDMVVIQNDTVDLMARELVPHIVKIGQSGLSLLHDQQMKKNAEFVINKLKYWHGEMDEMSTGATVYSVFQVKFYNTLLHDHIKDEDFRLALVGNYPFIDFVQRLIITIDSDPSNERFNKVCKGAYHNAYKGTSSCVYNLVRSMSEAYEFLVKELSPNPGDWEWKNIHVNEYVNAPWSYLKYSKPFFHREVPVGGNGNTVKVSKYTFKSANALNSFKSNHCPNYKTIVDFDQSNSSLSENPQIMYSHDGGQSGNMFAGHYFDFNRQHLSGNLMNAVIGKAEVEQKNHQKLFIKPLSMKKSEDVAKKEQKAAKKEKLSDEYEREEF